MATRHAKNAGFTIIELMIVVVIIGIVAAMVGPSFREVQNHTNLEASFRTARSAVQRCRSAGINAHSPATDPTMPALVFFSNGVACIQWADQDANMMIGDGSTLDMGLDNVLNRGDADNEVREVYFQDRFDTRYALNSADARVGVYIDQAASTLQPAGLAQTTTDTGIALVLAAGGYFQAPNRTTFVARVEMKQPVALEPRFSNPNFHPARFCIFPSAQTIDPLRTPGVCP